MKNISQKELILSLIKDNLIHSKLVNGLTAAGLESNLYFLRLGETIFNLMGFSDEKCNDEIYECYMKLFDKATYIDISQGDDALNDLTREIYNELLKRKLDQ